MTGPMQPPYAPPPGPSSGPPFGAPPAGPPGPFGAKAGWYPDPWQPGGQRWWDGGVWREAGPPKIDGLAVAGFVLSFLGGIIAVVLCIVALARGRGGRRRGRGFAIAGLVISVIWILALGGIVIAGLSGAFEHENVDGRTGEERRVAEVIDRAEAALEDGDATEFCVELRTREAQAIDVDCARRVDAQSSDIVGEVKIESLRIEGDTATVVTTDAGGRITWHLALVESTWLIDGVS
jgi:hypothetical protein